jgi:xylulokinase
MPKYLGLDSSTQSLTAIVIDTGSAGRAAPQIVAEIAVAYKDEPSLAQYHCQNGFLENADEQVRHADPLMWVAALDLLFAKGDPKLWKEIAAISGSGQQHGSVYLNDRFRDAGWSPQAPLAEQVKPLLSRATAPIWMDSSTSDECEEITAAAGGVANVVKITGSRATERFTGPQIRKFYKQSPEDYQSTARIHLVSSFVAWLLTGVDAPIDRGDGAGMNLMDLAAGDWSEQLLAATAPDLRKKLARCASSRTDVGAIAPYFCQKYSFDPACRVIAFSGDNCNSLVGMGSAEAGTAVISLGTSDTYFAAASQGASEPITDPNGFGHVFGDSLDGFMTLICFKNGSLARERVARAVGMAKEVPGKSDESGQPVFSYDWDRFSDAILNESAPGNSGKWMLPYFDPEITPRVLKPEVKLFGGLQLSPADAPAACRAIVEAQALSMKLRSAWIGAPRRLLTTGGGSRNPGLSQVLADVFQREIADIEVPKSAALGAAIRAAVCAGGASPAIARLFAKSGSKVFKPNAAATAVYEEHAARMLDALGDMKSL